MNGIDRAKLLALAERWEQEARDAHAKATRETELGWMITAAKLRVAGNRASQDATSLRALLAETPEEPAPFFVSREPPAEFARSAPVAEVPALEQFLGPDNVRRDPGVAEVPAPRKILRDLSTAENRKFWSRADEVAAEVEKWPDWKRAGINVAESHKETK